MIHGRRGPTNNPNFPEPQPRAVLHSWGRGWEPAPVLQPSPYLTKLKNLSPGLFDFDHSQKKCARKSILK